MAMKTIPTSKAQDLIDAMRNHISPEGVALIAAKLQPYYGKGEAGQAAERECRWFADLLIELLGTNTYNGLIEEMGL